MPKKTMLGPGRAKWVPEGGWVGEGFGNQLILTIVSSASLVVTKSGARHQHNKGPCANVTLGATKYETRNLDPDSNWHTETIDRPTAHCRPLAGGFWKAGLEALPLPSHLPPSPPPALPFPPPTWL